MTKEYTKVCIQYDSIILYNVCTVKYKHWQKKKKMMLWVRRVATIIKGMTRRRLEEGFWDVLFFIFLVWMLVTWGPSICENSLNLKLMFSSFLYMYVSIKL